MGESWQQELKTAHLHTVRKHRDMNTDVCLPYFLFYPVQGPKPRIGAAQKQVSLSTLRDLI